MDVAQKDVVSIVKPVLGLAVSVGLYHITSHMISTNVPQKNFFEKATVFAGRVALILTVNDVVRRSTDAKVEAATDWVFKNFELSS